jgi:uncharacterized protein Yka (UPF0111/DUF47 family)
MTQATDTDIRDIKDLIVSLDRKVDKLESTIYSRLDKLESKIDKLEIKLDGKFDKLDERTKLSFWGFILRGLVLTALIGVGTYLLPVVAEYVHKLPPL